MIRSFKCKETERIWQGQLSRRFPSGIQNRALRKLRQLDATATVADLRNPPGNRLEALKGDRAGQMSIRINDQWRICFRWSKGDADDVEITDYSAHSSPAGLTRGSIIFRKNLLRRRWIAGSSPAMTVICRTGPQNTLIEPRA